MPFTHLFNLIIKNISRVVDPHHLFADPDAIYHPDADPAVDPDLD
jgi:hypothetical protein